jgi:hypothetical protein
MRLASSWWMLVAGFLPLASAAVDPGAPLGVPGVIVDADNADNRYPTVVRAPTGEFAVFWWGPYDISARFYDAMGVPRGEPFLANVQTEGQQVYPDAAIDGAGVLTLVFSSNGTPSGIRARRFALDGQPLSGEFSIDPGHFGAFDPGIAVAPDGNGVVIWTDDSDPGPIDPLNPSLSEGVQGQRIAADGTLIGPRFSIPVDPTGRQGNGAIAMAADGGFVVAWDGVGDGADVYMRRFAANGSPLGQARVNTTTAGEQVEPVVAMAADGSYVVAWLSEHDIVARRFAVDGAPLAGEFIVFAGAQFYPPALVMDPRGDFIVAGTSSSTGEVVSRLYDPAGVGRGGTQVLAAGGAQSGSAFPSLAMDVDGDAIVAWETTTTHDTGTPVTVALFQRRLGGVENVDLATTLTDGVGSAAPNSAGSYVVTVENRHPVGAAGVGQAQGVRVRLPLPTGVALTGGAAPGWTCATTPIVDCTLRAPLAAGDSATFSAAVQRPDATCLQVSATAVASSDEPDPALANDGASDDTRVGLPGTLVLAAASASVVEGAGSVRIGVQRQGGCVGAVGADVLLSPASAASAQDFSGGGMLTWTDGETGSKDAIATIVSDAIDEPSETFTLALANPAGGAVLGTPASATVTILDDDQPAAGNAGGGGGGPMPLPLLAALVVAVLARRP